MEKVKKYNLGYNKMPTKQEIGKRTTQIYKRIKPFLTQSRPELFQNGTPKEIRKRVSAYGLSLMGLDYYYVVNDNVFDIGVLMDYGRQVLSEDNIHLDRRKGLGAIIEALDSIISADEQLLVDGNFEGFANMVRKHQSLTARQYSLLKNLIVKKLTDNPNKKYSLKFTLDDGEELYVFVGNDKFWKHLETYMENDYFEVLIGGQYASDQWDEIHSKSIVDVEMVLENEPTKRMDNKGAEFFNYLNNSGLDLTRYQIISDISDYSKELTKEQCLIYALKMYGIDLDTINTIKRNIHNGNSIAKTEINYIVSIIQKNIKCHYYDKKSHQTRKYVYKGLKNSPKGYSDTINIGVIANHYFLIENTPYSSYAIKNYEKVKDIDNFMNISSYHSTYKKYIFDTKASRCNSFNLIRIFLEIEGIFTRDLELNFFEGNSEDKVMDEDLDDICLNNIEDEQLEYIYTPPESSENAVNIYFADLETDVTSKKVHIPLLAGIIGKDEKIPHIYMSTASKPNDSISKMFDYVSRNAKKDDKNIVFFHNLKYDFNILRKFVNPRNIRIKDNSVYSVEINYYGTTINLVDSYKHISKPLADFPKMFNLDKDLNKKDGIAYEYYTIDNINIPICEIEKYASFISNAKARNNFYENIKTNPKLFSVNDKTFDPVAYYYYYLKYDVLVLQAGMEKFAECIKQITGKISEKMVGEKREIDIYKFLTISSVSDYIVKSNGCYDGVYPICGNLRAFVARAIMGGRVHCNEKYLGKVVNKIISDFDGVSLYPSAMVRLCREFGLPLGKASKIDRGTNWIKYDYYVVEIKITKVGKKQNMPMICQKGNDKCEYTNYVSKNTKFVVDKYTLEDWVKFHKIEYEFVKGVYWNNGYNKKLGDVIYDLFQERLVYKKKETKNDSMSETIKLVMNSAYGKTITKLTNTDNIVVPREKWEKGELVDAEYYNKYVYNNFGSLISANKINDNCMLVKKHKIDDSYNFGQIGCSVLSMSKRIMNEVFDCANSIGGTVLYTDTDSIHIYKEDIPKLTARYRSEYGKRLEGNNLEQFHIDFNMSSDKKVNPDSIVSTKFICLGKKIYCDTLEGINDQGEIVSDYHFRAKGLTECGMLHVAKERFAGKMDDFYEHLIENAEEIELIPKGSKPKFHFKNVCMGVSTKRSMRRTIGGITNLRET